MTAPADVRPRQLRNLVANYVGAASTVVVGVLLVPAYLTLLGPEAYGIIGFYTTFNSVIQVLDLGLGMAVNRELARRSATDSNDPSTADLLRTIEVVYWAIGVAIGLCVWAASGWIASRWLVANRMPTRDIAHALSLMGLTVALQWPVSIYSGGLMGLQRQSRSVAVTAIGNVIFAVGAIGLLSISPSVVTFFLWRACVCFGTTVAQRAMLWRLIPRGDSSGAARFRLASLSGIWGFSVGMTGVALTGIALVQLDKIIVSRAIPLDQVGGYMTSSTAAGVIPYVVGPIFTSSLPLLSQSAALDDRAALIGHFHSTSRLIAAIVFPIACTVAFFAHPLLAVWTRNAGIAVSCAPVLSVLAVGALLNSTMVPLYGVQLAKGWTNVATATNCVLIAVGVPYGMIASAHWGALGAASTWLVLNAVYVLVGASLTLRKFLAGSVSEWLSRDVGVPLLISATVAFAFSRVTPRRYGDVASVAWIAFATLVSVGATVLANRDLRRQVSSALQRRISG